MRRRVQSIGVLLLQLAWARGAAGAGDLFVSARGGSDSNRGRSAGSPLATMGRAAQLVEAGDKVHVAPGQYILTATLDLDVENTTWVAEGGGVSVSGGAHIDPSAWEPATSIEDSEDNVLLRADVSSLNLDPSTRHLFVNGRRAP